MTISDVRGRQVLDSRRHRHFPRSDRTTARHPTDQLAGMAEGKAAIHAAGALQPEFVFRHVLMKLFPILNAFDSRTIQRQFSKVLYESSGFSHFSLLDVQG